MKLKISITTEPIGFSILGKLYIGPVIVLCYFIFRFKLVDSFKTFFYLRSALLNIEPLDASGEDSSIP